MREHYDGIEDDFDLAMQRALRDDAREAHERQMRALFAHGRPSPVRLKRSGRSMALAGDWPALMNLHEDLLRMSLLPSSSSRGWMTWDGEDCVTYTLATGSAVCQRTEHAGERQDAKVITYRMVRSERSLTR